ncbi:AHH domain-containing protein [Sorangium sp. So ce367]|uniref:AHH domain-containing protein n=1 Tax=Sorangium sp. So ce367 TaxID=3133305 RepID=UPI003F5E55AF
MGDEKQHKFDNEVLGLHDCTGSTEGGACLTRHEFKSPVALNNSCSYRWQAIVRAMGEDRTYYNGKRSSWDVTVNGFRWSASKPYPHQAHHILPKGTLDDAMLTTAQKSNTTLLAIILRMGLLQAKYNLNHKDNMMILPTGLHASRILSLPRHLGSHPNYNAIVQSKVQPVIDEYAQLLEKAAAEPENHPAAPDKLSKAKLMRVSAQMRALVLTWARGTGGTRLETQATP